MKFDNIERIEFVTDPDGLADIDQDYYENMVEAMVSKSLGGEYEYEFTNGQTTNHGVSVTLKNDDDPAEYEEWIAGIIGDAFAACCRGDEIPDV